MEDVGTLVVVRNEDPCTLDAEALLDEMDASWALFYGESGRTRDFHEEIRSPRSTFLVVRTLAGFAVGCAALRRCDYCVGEVKYLYSRAARAGIGHALMSRLQSDASALGYRSLALRLHLSDRRTIAFCQRNGFAATNRFAGARGAPERKWFEKALIPREDQPKALQLAAQA
ncbi:hypothetical protein AWB74_07303 [Caballeronia arvi]|uniref:N-acetyltransferase domain-containing protein n=1 Tax=Caballeronia arvi TaxID=1777135 RepID=A0A158KW90_9BURK|nr:GNAT family N-acetyltransferase [Caballeronia arvi]SAL85436.1 hypothetical protein AWB74_07303 [Caballeronia arvi]